jgi:hypothetical protein
VTDAGYIAVGYVAVFGSILLYTVRVLAKGRRSSKHVPEGERRWL